MLRSAHEASSLEFPFLDRHRQVRAAGQGNKRQGEPFYNLYVDLLVAMRMSKSKIELKVDAGYKTGGGL